MSVIDVENYTTVATIDVGTEPWAVVATIPVGRSPRALAITNGDDTDDTDETLYVPNFFARPHYRDDRAPDQFVSSGLLRARGRLFSGSKPASAWTAIVPVACFVCPRTVLDVLAGMDDGPTPWLTDRKCFHWGTATSATPGRGG